MIMDNTEYLLNLIYLGGIVLIICFVIPRKKGWAKNVLIASCVCLLSGVAAFLAAGVFSFDPETTHRVTLFEKIAKGLGLTGLLALALTRNLRPKEDEKNQDA
jgi:hypothetical protein